VVLLAPFEGNERGVGYDALYSARLAVRELNEAGGIDGRRVALVVLDDGGDPRLAEGVAWSVVQDTAVVAVLGHWLPETTAVAQPIYQQANLLFIPLETINPTEPLPPDFIRRYEAITPFDETPGPYALPTYQAFQQLWARLGG
jgi:ABC-type branched-subunit amino acid transport system substrate-binding protein